MDGKVERRWLGTSRCDNERTIALRKNALRAYEGKSSELIPPGPRSRVGTTGKVLLSAARLQETKQVPDNQPPNHQARYPGTQYNFPRALPAVLIHTRSEQPVSGWQVASSASCKIARSASWQDRKICKLARSQDSNRTNRIMCGLSPAGW